MNKYFIAALAIVMATSLLGSTASAAFLGFGEKEVVSVSEDSWSFDSLYYNIRKQASSMKQPEGRAFTQSALSATSVIPAASKAPATKKAYVVAATGYSSTPDQTDDSPFITAWGTHVRDGVVAANFLPFGTAIKIPDIYGDKVFIVEDRMNKRYTERVDVWFPDRQSALQFGLKKIRIEVI